LSSFALEGKLFFKRSEYRSDFSFFFEMEIRRGGAFDRAGILP
jgi:hypothetical protein